MTIQQVLDSWAQAGFDPLLYFYEEPVRTFILTALIMAVILRVVDYLFRQVRAAR